MVNYKIWRYRKKRKHSRAAFKDYLFDVVGITPWWFDEPLVMYPKVGEYCKTCAKVYIRKRGFGYPDPNCCFCQVYTKENTRNCGKPPEIFSFEKKCPHYVWKEWYKSCQDCANVYEYPKGCRQPWNDMCKVYEFDFSDFDNCGKPKNVVYDGASCEHWKKAKD